MSNVFFVLLLITMVAVAGVLVTGIVVMGKGGDLNARYGNKLMQARVILQGLALLFFALTVMTRH